MQERWGGFEKSSVSLDIDMLQTKSKLHVGRNILLTLIHLHLVAPKTKWEFHDKQVRQTWGQIINLEVNELCWKFGETNFTSDLFDWTDNTTIELTTHVCFSYGTGLHWEKGFLSTHLLSHMMHLWECWFHSLAHTTSEFSSLWQILNSPLTLETCLRIVIIPY
jgi:hypothetical protein